MKKKLTVISVLVIVLALLASGSLAWFTADDEVTNTFTIGSVKIEIEEDFADPENMIPVVNADPSDPNYVNKDARVKNTGENAAYVQMFLAIPKALDDAGAFIVVDDNASNWVKSAAGTATIGGELCNVYKYQYNKELAVGAVTSDAITAAYLAPQLDYQNGLFVMNGTPLTTYTPGDSINIYVSAQAIQAEGFADYGAALATFGTGNPWSN